LHVLCNLKELLHADEATACLACLLEWKLDATNASGENDRHKKGYVFWCMHAAAAKDSKHC
jgi:hypothetical protein